jgi:polyisoprenoid-binding protein YceI
MKAFSSLGLALALALTASVGGAAFAGRSEGNAQFTAAGPAGMSIVGTTRDVKVEEDAQGTVIVTVRLATLTTGIELRDKHMREKYLEVGTFPTAVLKVPRASLKIPGPGENGSFETDGTLTLHGQTKTTHFRYTAKNEGGVFGVRGTMPVNMNDYGIATPGYLGVAVKQNVDVTVTFSAEDKQ